MASVSTLVERVRMYAPGVSEPLAIQLMLDAADEFCRDTWVCQEQTPAVVTASGRLEPQSPGGYIPLAVMRLVSNGKTIWSKWPNVIDNAAGYADISNFPQAQPLMFGMTVDPLVLSMIPAATTPQTITATVAVTIDTTIDDVPDALVQSWAKALTSKALEDILIMPVQSWSNSGLADRFAKDYLMECHKARVEVNRGYARHGAAMTGPKFIGR